MFGLSVLCAHFVAVYVHSHLLIYSTNKFSRISISVDTDVHRTAFFHSRFLVFITAKHHKLKCTSYIIIIFFCVAASSIVVVVVAAIVPMLKFSIAFHFFLFLLTICLLHFVEHYYNSQWKIDCKQS